MYFGMSIVQLALTGAFGGTVLGGFVLLLRGEEDTKPMPPSSSVSSGDTDDQSSSDGDWPTFGYDNARTAAVPNTPGPLRDLETLWATNLGLRDENGRAQRPGISTEPVANDGIVFVATTDGELRAVDIESGELEWATTLGETEPTMLGINDGYLYAATTEGIHSYRTQDGEYLWTINLGDTDQLVIGDHLYAGTAEGVGAFTPSEGDESWFSETPGSVTTLAADGDTVFAATGTKVYAFDPSEGTTLWQTELRGSDPSLAVGEHLIVTTQSGLAGLDKQTGEEKWWNPPQDDAGGESPVAVVGMSVYQVTNNAIRAYDSTEGVERWHVEADVETAPIVAGSTVYCGTSTGLIGLSAEDGELLFTHDIEVEMSTGGYEFTQEDRRSQSRPIAVGNVLICQSTQSELLAIVGEVDQAASMESGSNPTSQDELSAPDHTSSSTPAGQEIPEPSTSTLSLSPAVDRFDQECEHLAVRGAIDENGPTHIYQGSFVDGIDKQPARIYTVAPEYADQPDVLAAFLDAARRWRGISKNKHIATVHETGEDPRPWIAFDPGESHLDDVLRDLTEETRIEVVSDLAEAIRTARMYNVGHGSIRPEVVFLTEDSDGNYKGTLADWGLQADVQTETTNQWDPTPYTAPQQLQETAVGLQTDIYQLGAVSYYILSECDPFGDPESLEVAIKNGNQIPITEQDESIPDPVSDVIHQAMDPNPDQRFSTPYDFQQRFLGAFDW